MEKPKICFNVRAEMLEAFKIKLLSEQQEGYRNTDMSIKLALYLVERAQAWERLEHDERVHHGSSI